MSRIMRELYAEARRARQASEDAAARGAGGAEPAAPGPPAAGRSGIDWWVAHYEQAGRAATGSAATEAGSVP